MRGADVLARRRRARVTQTRLARAVRLTRQAIGLIEMDRLRLDQGEYRRLAAEIDRLGQEAADTDGRRPG